MNKKKLIIPAVIILVMSGLFATANNYHWFGINTGSPADLPGAKEELRKLYAKYSDPAASFNINGTIRLFDKENDDKLKEQMPFGYSKQGLQFYMRIGSQQTFFTDSLLLQLDTTNKYMIISAVNKESVPVPPSGVLPFEKFMQDTSIFKIEAVVSEKNKERALTIKSELNPEIKVSTIYYDPVTYTIRRAEIEWWKEATVYNNEDGRKKIWLTVIEYSYPASPVLPVTERIKKIIVQKNGKIEPVPAFSDYQVQSSF